jgi:hypothetical protein
MTIKIKMSIPLLPESTKIIDFTEIDKMIQWLRDLSKLLKELDVIEIENLSKEVGFETISEQIIDIILELLFFMQKKTKITTAKRNPQISEMEFVEENVPKEFRRFQYDKLKDGTVNLEKKEFHRLEITIDEIFQANLEKIMAFFSQLRLNCLRNLEPIHVVQEPQSKEPKVKRKEDKILGVFTKEDLRCSHKYHLKTIAKETHDGVSYITLPEIEFDEKFPIHKYRYFSYVLRKSEVEREEQEKYKSKMFYHSRKFSRKKSTNKRRKKYEFNNKRKNPHFASK